MESSSSPENLPCHRKRAIQELIQGLEFTRQLQMRVGKLVIDDGSSPASVDDLVVKIMGTFRKSLSILNFCDSNEVSQIPASVLKGSPSWEDSGESSKTPALKDRRGCYKRRKTSETYERVTSTLIDDGHAWRKYGQKVILNANHPRNYYRCTHKYEQGCQATKQVQKSEDDPPMYRTTYHGHHTCRNLLKAPQIILDSTTTCCTRDSSILLSFESKGGILEKKPDNPYFPIIKHEYKEDLQCLNHHDYSSSSSDCLISPPPDLTTTFDSSEPMTMLSSGSDVISSGIYSCTTSSHSFEMDMMVGNVNFDDFQFEFCS